LKGGSLVDIELMIPLEAYFSSHVEKGKLDANGMTGLCPFHEDKARSFSVNLRTSQWICFAGCGDGNIASFHAKITGTDTKTAYKDLLNIYNLSDEKKKPPPPDPIDKSITEKFAKNMTPEVITYLANEKGWSQDVITKYQIGYIQKEKRVSIPIVDEKGIVVNIRKYKPNAVGEEIKVLSWKKGLGKSRLFPISILEETPIEDPIVISEGEADTLCGLSHGLACITQTAGAKTWKPEFNKVFKGRRIIIAYDNDEAGREGTLTVLKYVSAVAESVETIQWPDYFNEKEDLSDFFVKYGKTAEDFFLLDRQAFNKETSIESETGVLEKLDIVVEHGCYFNIKETKYSLVKTKISNFTLEIVKTFQTPEGAMRSVRLLSENGEISKESEIKPEDMASKFHFTRWCFGQGNFQWKGSQTDLENVWSIEMTKCDKRIIYRPDHIGEIEGEKIWLFGNYAIKDGEVYSPNQEEIVWIKDHGYQPLSLNVSEGSSSGCLPLMRNDIPDNMLDEIQGEMVRLTKQNIGGYEAYLALGFIAACVYSTEIFTRYKFPILFISGKKEVGKNTLARIIVNHFGLEEEIAKNISDVSNVALTRWLAYYSGIPLWLDEYRNASAVQKHESILRSAYDRIGGGTRGKLGFGVVGQKMRAPVMITGEGFPKDSALASRCVRIQLSLMRRNDEIFKKIEGFRGMLSGIVHRFIVNKPKIDIASLYSDIDTLSEALGQGDVDPRLAKIYASLAVCFIRIYDPNQVCGDHGDFIEWLKYSAFQVKQEKEDSFILNEFFFDIEGIRAEDKLDGDYVEVIRNKVFGYAKGQAPESVVKKEGVDVARIWLRGIYNKWSEMRRRRGEEIWSYYDLLHYLKDERYYIEPPLTSDGHTKPQLLNGKKRRCFDLDLDKLPNGIRDVFITGWGGNSAVWGT